MTRPGPSEQDRLAAARAWYVGMGYEDADQIERLAEAAVATGRYDPIVDSAFAAGWRARVPEGSEEREEWGTRHLDIETCERLISFARSRDAASASFDYLNEVWGHHAELIRRKVITTPWCPVEEEA